VTPVHDKRPAHQPSRRKEIIAAATKTFSRDGYVEARIEDIARAAGVAPTAIYYHFGGKEELFTQALRAAMAGFSERISWPARISRRRISTAWARLSPRAGSSRARTRMRPGWWRYSEGPISRVARGPLVAVVEEMCISLLMSLADQLCHGSASWVTSIS
jgi:AcrR family transcriptional regulator